MNKRAFSLSWEVLVTGLIAIVAAGIVLYIVFDGFEQGGKNIEHLSSCETSGGNCMSKDQCDAQKGTGVKGFGCEDKDSAKPYCCTVRT